MQIKHSFYFFRSPITMTNKIYFIFVFFTSVIIFIIGSYFELNSQRKTSKLAWNGLLKNPCSFTFCFTPCMSDSQPRTFYTADEDKRNCRQSSSKNMSKRKPVKSLIYYNDCVSFRREERITLSSLSIFD